MSTALLAAPVRFHGWDADNEPTAYVRIWVMRAHPLLLLLITAATARRRVLALDRNTNTPHLLLARKSASMLASTRPLFRIDFPAAVDVVVDEDAC